MKLSKCTGVPLIRNLPVLGSRAGNTTAVIRLEFFALASGVIVLFSSSKSSSVTRSYLLCNLAPPLIPEILDLEKRAAGGEDVTEELNKKKARLNYLSKENAIGKSLMQQTEFAEDVLKSITKTLQKEMISDRFKPYLNPYIAGTNWLWDRDFNNGSFRRKAIDAILKNLQAKHNFSKQRKGEMKQL